MKIAIVLFALVAMACAESHYSTKYDNIDVNQILANRRLLKRYVDCLMEKGPCTEEGRYLKSVLSDALVTGCEKCSDIQKQKVRTVIKHLRVHSKPEWESIIARYDPEGIFRKKYENRF